MATASSRSRSEALLLPHPSVGLGSQIVGRGLHRLEPSAQLFLVQSASYIYGYVLSKTQQHAVHGTQEDRYPTTMIHCSLSGDARQKNCRMLHRTYIHTSVLVPWHVAIGPFATEGLICSDIIAPANNKPTPRGTGRTVQTNRHYTRPGHGHRHGHRHLSAGSTRTRISNT